MAADRDRTLLTPREAAALLGVSRPTISVLVDEEGLPCFILRGGDGRRRVLRFRASEIVAWFEARRGQRVRNSSRHTLTTGRQEDRE